MEVFIIDSKDIEGRIDPMQYHPIRIAQLKKVRNYSGSIKRLEEIADFCQIVVTKNSKNLPYVGLENIESGSGEFINLKNKEIFSSAVFFKEDLILFPKLRPYLNKVFYANIKGIASTEFYVLKAKKCLSKYLYYFLQSDTIVKQTTYLMTGNTLPRLQTENVKKLLIPIPENIIQEKIIQIMDDAYSRKKRNEKEAEKLLNSYSELINELIHINLNSASQKKTFSIYLNDLEGALNPERYASKIKLDNNFTWIPIKNIGDVIRETFTPSRSNPENEYGLIRIDDLKNNPQDAIIRNVQGKRINGIILKVQENDILIARLGPTLENKKTIIAPPYCKQLISSNEFICLRCKENVNPIFVLVFLKTDLYKNLMIQKSRGATPSRRRLSHEDFTEMPFPNIDKTIQDKIALKYIRNIKKAKLLKKEAYEALKKAKKEVEEILFE